MSSDQRVAAFMPKLMNFYSHLDPWDDDGMLESDAREILHIVDSLPERKEMSFEEARWFVRGAHAGQVDKAGRPYYEHVEAVADILAQSGFDARLAGLFHDLLEDTNVTAEYLRDLGVNEDVISAVVACTRLPDESYFDFIRRVAEHPLGRLVKLADNLHNSSKERLDALDPEIASSLLKKYLRAREILMDMEPGSLDPVVSG